MNTTIVLQPANVATYKGRVLSRLPLLPPSMQVFQQA
jgi:hypothetical protein